MNNWVKVLICLSLVLCAFFIGCNRWQQVPLDITEVKVSAYCPDLIIIAWTTTEPTECVVSSCVSDNVCTPLGAELEYNILHLFVDSINPTDNKIEYVIITATSVDGSAVSEQINIKDLTNP